jgi:integrase
MVTLQLHSPVWDAAVMDVADIPTLAVRETNQTGPPKPRLLDRVREAIRTRHYSRRTEKAYVAWIRLYIFFHGKRHPADMGAAEITRFLTSLAAFLRYGAGLRLLECARLRVKDIDIARNQIVVRAGKGNKDRLTVLPAAIKADLMRHLESVRRQHQIDLQAGAGCSGRSPRSTPMPGASGPGSGSFRQHASTSTG